MANIGEAKEVIRVDEISKQTFHTFFFSKESEDGNNVAENGEMGKLKN